MFLLPTSTFPSPTFPLRLYQYSYMLNLSNLMPGKIPSPSFVSTTLTSSLWPVLVPLSFIIPGISTTYYPIYTHASLIIHPWGSLSSPPLLSMPSSRFLASTNNLLLFYSWMLWFFSPIPSLYHSLYLNWMLLPITLFYIILKLDDNRSHHSQPNCPLFIFIHIPVEQSQKWNISLFERLRLMYTEGDITSESITQIFTPSPLRIHSPMHHLPIPFPAHYITCWT